MNTSNTTTRFWEDLKSGHFASMIKEASKGKSLSNSWEVYNITKPLFAKEDDVEKLFVVFLDGDNKILAIENLFSGTINSSSVYPRELVKRILNLKAAAIVMVHNHPSGNLSPSDQDKSITVHIAAVTSILEVVLHDHIIIGNGFYSMSDDGLLQNIKDRVHAFLVDIKLKAGIDMSVNTQRTSGAGES